MHCKHSSDDAVFFLDLLSGVPQSGPTHFHHPNGFSPQTQRADLGWRGVQCAVPSACQFLSREKSRISHQIPVILWGTLTKHCSYAAYKLSQFFFYEYLHRAAAGRSRHLSSGRCRCTFHHSRTGSCQWNRIWTWRSCTCCFSVAAKKFAL